MARRRTGTDMTRTEIILGGAALALYLVVLPLTAEPLFDGIERLFALSLGEDVRDAAYYYILFALTAAALWGYFGRTTRAFFDHAWRTLGNVGLGLVAFYGLNELSWRILRMAAGGQVNLNDQAILARMGDAPRTTILIVVFLAPVVEEALFRGYVFGNLREYSRAAAYLASSLLFAGMHVWQFVVLQHNLAYLPVMLQYVAPGLVMAWVYERSENLWGSVLLHGMVNALAVWSAM